MAEMILNRNMVIDEVQTVVSSIERLSGKQLRDMAAVKKFILQEKNTAFYIDRSLNSYMLADLTCPYVWLDTGHTDHSGNPIMISLVREGDSYRGHHVNTLMGLINMVISKFRLNRKKVQGRISNLKNKYNAKSSERKTAHITDEDRYILSEAEDEQPVSEFAAKIKALNINFEEAVEEEPETAQSEPEEEDGKEHTRVNFTAFEEEITIDLLLDIMGKMQVTIDALYNRIESMSDQSAEQDAQMSAMAEQINEYRSALVRMRNYKDSEQEAEEAARASEDPAQMPGHALLGNHGQILVIGGEALGNNVMCGIAKDYGFVKSDFEFMGYDKAKKNMDRIRRDGRYKAIIFGACPHKTSATGEYNSALDKFRIAEGMPYTVDARCTGGSLKVTKTSFREALANICESLRGPVRGPEAA